LRAAQGVAVATARPPTDESELATTVGDQPLQLEHRPALAGRAIRREFVPVLMKGVERVDRAYGGSAVAQADAPSSSASIS